MENPLVIVAAPEHRLAKRKRIQLKELENEVFLTREPGSGTRGAMERFFRQQKLKLTTGMGMGSLSSIKQGVQANLKQGVQANLGLGLLPRDAAQVELQIGRLVELKVKGLPIRRHWYVVLHKGKRLSLAAEELMWGIPLTTL
jgi:DNA-binding transcriptional LysR family regulator